LGVATQNNPDFSHIHLDTLRVDDARSLKSLTGERGYSEKKKIFLISSNNILLEAQNTMLKMFEEPIEDTIFFVIVPDHNALLSTFISRFHFIPASRARGVLAQDGRASEFIKMPLQMRINYIKDLVAAEDEEDMAADSTRAKALNFLNELEAVVQKMIMGNSSDFTLSLRGGAYTDKNFPIAFFEQAMKVRKLLRMPGSSPKMLLESVALVI